MRKWIQKALQQTRFKSLIGLIILVPLSACYVPDNYGAEIRITKDGNFGISYSGELTWAPLYGQIVRGEIESDLAAEQVAGFTADLKQDGNFEYVASLGRGRYEVRYDRQGVLTRTQVVSFIRRNARIFQFQALEDGTVKFSGRRASALQADQLEGVGLQNRGLLRIVTDAPVSEHNATAVRPSPIPGYVMYDWQVSSFRDPAPRLTLQLSGPLPTSPGA